MWPKFLEELRPLTISFGGRSYSNGFDIRVATIYARHTWVFSYRASEFPSKERTDWLVLSVLLAAFWLATFTHVFLVAFLLLSLFLDSLAGEKCFKSWHWCEHQIVKLLLENTVPTEGLVRSQNPLTVMYGSVRRTIHILFSAALGACIVNCFCGETLSATVDLVVLGSAAAAILVHEDHMRVSRRNFLWYPLCYIALPVLSIGMLVQRIFFLRRPSRLQSEYALNWGKDAMVATAKALLEDAAAAHQPAP